MKLVLLQFDFQANTLCMSAAAQREQLRNQLKLKALAPTDWISGFIGSQVVKAVGSQ